MPKGLKRHYGQGHFHFITFSCFRRLPLLGRAHARTVFVRILGDVRTKYNFKVVGYVVMPEHVHLLISEPSQGTPSTVMQVLKQRVSRRLRQRKRRRNPGQLRLWSGGISGNGLRSFWQRRFHDFNVFTSKKKNEKLHYMHMNPVKRRLVEHPRDWPWSSYNFYSRKGVVLLSMDPVE